jgi:hypothetical protein
MKVSHEAERSERPPAPAPRPRAARVTAVRQTEPGRPRRAWSLLLKSSFERK